MSVVLCPKCKEDMKLKGKVIETVDYRLDDYKMKKAMLHECIKCKFTAYVTITEDMEGDQ